MDCILFHMCVYFNKKFKIKTATLRCHFAPLGVKIEAFVDRAPSCWGLCLQGPSLRQLLHSSPTSGNSYCGYSCPYAGLLIVTM